MVRWLGNVRVRVTLTAVAIVALALAVAGAWFVQAHRSSLRHGIESTARQRARDIASSVADGQFPRIIAVPRGDENLIQIVDANGEIVAASTNAGFESRISRVEPHGDGFTSATVEHLASADAPLRVVVERIGTPSGAVTVYVAKSLEPVQRSVDSLMDLLFVGFPIILGFVGVTTWFVTGRALRPVEGIRLEVESIGKAHDLRRRVPVPRTADEIGRLASTMNGMLERLEDATNRQRQFVDDASHELRSPLTSIRAQIEVDLSHPEQARWESLAREVLDDTVRMQRLVDDLLALAQTDVSAEEPNRCESLDLDEIVLSEARRLREHTSLRVDTSGVSGAQLVGNADELGRAVRNLLDNADRHAATLIEVSLTESDQAVTLTVADDGLGIPLDQRERIFERFARLDGARTRDSGGTGLGLAITHDIVTSHGGTITVVDAPGARFAAVFPLACAAR